MTMRWTAGTEDATPVDVVAGQVRADHPGWPQAEVYREAARASLGEGTYASLYEEVAREFRIYKGKEPTHYEPPHRD